MRTALTATQARRLRAHNQRLRGSSATPERVVRRAAALQGQDLPAVLRAIALRSRPGTGTDGVVGAFNEGLLVRSWPMRGTLFATTPRVLAVLLHHTAERTHRAAALRRRQLGLDPGIVDRARRSAREALAEHPRTRSELLAVWAAEGIDPTAGRGYHLIVHLALDGDLHWGRFAASGTEQLLEPTAAAPVDDPDGALADVLRAYVDARGPVTLEDAAWWTKLPKTVLRRVLARIEGLAEVAVAGAPAWVLAEHLEAVDGLAPGGVVLVPGFDEWILGYADRSLVAGPEALRALVPGGNGVFKPAILNDGAVVGTWTPPRRGTRPEDAVSLVEPVPPGVAREIRRAVSDWPFPA